MPEETQLTDEQMTAKGEAIANLLHLKETGYDRYDTTYGTKTAKGLYLTVKRVMEET